MRNDYVRGRAVKGAQQGTSEVEKPGRLNQRSRLKRLERHGFFAFARALLRTLDSTATSIIGSSRQLLNAFARPAIPQIALAQTEHAAKRGFGRHIAPDLAQDFQNRVFAPFRHDIIDNRIGL